MRLATYTMIFWSIYALANAYDTPDFERDDLISTRLRVPSQMDLASAIGLVGNRVNNYGNPASVFSKNRILNFSIGQNHWPLFPFTSWSYSAQVPLKVGVGTPIGESYIATTLLLDYLFYGCCANYAEQLHRGILGGDFYASYRQKLGLNAHWLTTNRTLTVAMQTDPVEESLFGVSVGGKLGSQHGWVGRLDTHTQDRLESRKFEFSILFRDHSLSYRYVDRQGEG